MSTVISVEHLSKSYRLGQIGTGTFSRDLELWWAKIRGKPNPLLKIGERDQDHRVGEELLALNDVSFRVAQGEILGIIGRNGAGKSTLLKVLARVTAPTSGRIKIRGRVASLLEVGTGFHPELNGRENIYLNGAILGMKRDEIARKFDEIVDFAEVEKFIDTPVKRYSSGMYVRLAFAVAAHLEPEILVVDEVLAVGDAEFQAKCLGKMGAVAKEGRTVLFVSHDMGAIGSLCQNGILLRNGQIIFMGTARNAVDQYLLSTVKHEHESKRSFPVDPGKPLQVLEINLVDHLGKSGNQFDLAESVCIKIRYRVGQPLRGSNIALTLRRNGTDLFCSFDTDKLPHNLEERLPGEHVCKVVIPAWFLKAGLYTVSLATGRINQASFEKLNDIITFRIEELSADTSFRGYREERPGIVISPADWQNES